MASVVTFTTFGWKKTGQWPTTQREEWLTGKKYQDVGVYDTLWKTTQEMIIEDSWFLALQHELGRSEDFWDNGPLCFELSELKDAYKRYQKEWELYEWKKDKTENDIIQMIKNILNDETNKSPLWIIEKLISQWNTSPESEPYLSKTQLVDLNTILKHTKHPKNATLRVFYKTKKTNNKTITTNSE